MIGETLGPTIWDRLEAEPGHQSAVDVARDWLDALPSGLAADALDDAVHGRGAGAPTLASALAVAGLDRWAVVVGALARGAGDLDEALARAVLFRAGLALVRSGTRDDLLEIARASYEPYRHSEHIFSAHLARLLATDAPAKNKLEKRLAALIRDAQGHPERLAWRPREGELEPVPATTQLLWSSAYSQAMLRHGWAYEALRADPKAYTRLLAALPAGLAHTTVNFARDLGIEEICCLLRAAPAAFKAGKPISTGLVYALLERAQQDLAKLDKAQISAAIDSLVTAVLTRRDARWMARSWCQRVLWEVSHWRIAKTAEWPLPLFNALTAKLKPLPEAQSRAWIEAEQLDLWQVDRVLVETAILLDHGGHKGAPDLLAWALSTNRISATGRQRALEPNTFESNLIAQAFEGADLRGWFEAVWEAGYPSRERHRTTPHRKIDDTARSSIIWALAALNTAPSDRAGTWEAVFVALREMYLLDQDYNWFGDDGAAAFRFAGALCTAFVAKGALELDRLTAFLDLVAAPTPTFAGCIAMMAQQDEQTALAGAKTLADRRVAWALESGVLAMHSGKAELNPDALARVKAFAAQLP